MGRMLCLAISAYHRWVCQSRSISCAIRPPLRSRNGDERGRLDRLHGRLTSDYYRSLCRLVPHNGLGPSIETARKRPGQETKGRFGGLQLSGGRVMDGRTRAGCAHGELPCWAGLPKARPRNQTSAYSGKAIQGNSAIALRNSILQHPPCL